MKLKIEYRFESDDMSEEEYNDQEEQELIIDRETLTEILIEYMKNDLGVEIAEGKSICKSNFFVTESRS